MSALQKTEAGQILLVVTCLLYLAFWYHGYRPDEAVSRTKGITGLFLLLTTGAGLGGTVLTLDGLNAFPKPGAVSGSLLIGGAVVLYLVLMGVTGIFFSRPVTTELLLIVLWALLEACMLSTLQGNGILTDGKLVFCLILLVGALVFSLILYIAYYRMDPWPAFWWAMGPLISEAVVMAVYVFVCLI
jgi:hypothetical protein